MSSILHACVCVRWHLNWLNCSINGIANHTCSHSVVSLFCLFLFFSSTFLLLILSLLLLVLSFGTFLNEQNYMRESVVLLPKKKKKEKYKWISMMTVLYDGYFMFYCYFCCAYMMILVSFFVGSLVHPFYIVFSPIVFNSVFYTLPSLCICLTIR